MNTSDKELNEPVVYQGDQTMRLIMHAALDAIICFSIREGIMVWNPKAEKIFGWKEQEVLGKTLYKTIIPVQQWEQYEIALRHYLETGTSSLLNNLVEITAINKEGKEFPVELTIVSVKQNTSEFFCAFLRDITERKKANE